MPEVMQTGTRTDPYRAYNFKLDIKNITAGHFTECVGIGAKIQTIPYREGGVGEIVRRLPGPVEYSDVTLRYGLTQSKELWDWFMSAVEGKVVRKNISIVLMDTDGSTEVDRWELIDAWPAEMRGAPLNALGQEVAIESVTLVYESLKRG